MDDDLWSFALRFYDDAETQEHCLRLQDEFGGDVPVALCLLWHAARGRVTEADAIRALDAAVAPWREEVVRPLRALRRKLKTEALNPDAAAQEGFRSQVKKVELSAEKVQLKTLEAATLPGRDGVAPAEAARETLAAYGTTLPAPLADDLIDALVARMEAIAAP